MEILILYALDWCKVEKTIPRSDDERAKAIDKFVQSVRTIKFADSESKEGFERIAPALFEAILGAQWE